jgi:hypothetical protein
LEADPAQRQEPPPIVVEQEAASLAAF